MVPLPHLSALLTSAVLVLGAPALPKRDDDLVIPGKYIVTLKPGFSVAEASTHLNWVRSVHSLSSRSSSDSEPTGIEKVYSLSDFHAYAGTFDASTLDSIRSNYYVAAIEPDMIWTLDAAPLVTQSPSPWNLAALSHRSPGNHTSYAYHPAAGANTFAYVIDSGVRTTHSEFAPGRATLGYNAIPGSSSQDYLSHGTHVAATIAGRTYGVAKQASVIAVKVFDRSLSSTTSTVMDGYAWAVNNITSTPGRAQKSVVSLSLGGPVSAAFNALVAKAYAEGVVTVVSAGNEGVEAGRRSPASAGEAITVGAVDWEGARPGWSNYGEAVDLFAPGVGVVSAWATGDGEVMEMEGTSMAAPHVSGLVLYLKSVVGGRFLEAAGVWEGVKGLATRGVVRGGGAGSPDLVAFNGAGEL